jgi:hypothetical protein
MQITIDTSTFKYEDVPLPEVWTVRQVQDAPVIADISSAAMGAAYTLLADPRLLPGASVAVGVGSRGIANLAEIVRTVISVLKQKGCKPFIVPAMGSHGGATAEGQASILADYGITEPNVGAPVRATMEVIQVGALDDGYPVYFDCNALSADAVIVINRIKHHTDFSGEVESGLGKMCAIGLGKQKGAATIHRFGAQGLRNTMPKVARKLVEMTNIVGGIGIIENQFGQTAEIHGVPAIEFAERGEKQLLQRARSLCPSLPFQDIDVLVLDFMGKDISGSGMDTHVIGRLRMPSVDECEWDGPNVRIVCVLDLTDRSHGNAAGLGLADMTTRKLIERTDFGATMMNHFTSGEGGIYRGKLPLILDDEGTCVRAAIAGCGRGHYKQVRLVRIRNTEFVQTMEVSAAMLEECRERTDLDVSSEPHRLNLSDPLEAGHP